MDKRPLIVVCICAVILLVLGSLTNVVGFQTVQSSNQKIIKNKVNQKELLYQTIIDLANNNEIRKIAYNSEMNRGGFLNLDIRFLMINSPGLTKNQLKYMYLGGLMLSKFISKARIHSIISQYQGINQKTRNELNAIIEKNNTLNKELNQLANLNCDCEKNSTMGWNFPVICTLLFPIMVFLWILVFWTLMLFNVELHFFYSLFVEIGLLGSSFNCFWA